jgi:hypothetical protein
LIGSKYPSIQEHKGGIYLKEFGAHTRQLFILFSHERHLGMHFKQFDRGGWDSIYPWIQVQFNSTDYLNEFKLHWVQLSKFCEQVKHLGWHLEHI